MILFWLGFGWALTTDAQDTRPCQLPNELMNKKQDKAVWLSHVQLKKHAIKEVVGTVPGTGCIWRDTVVVVKVVVNKAGVVECAALASKRGNPLIRAGAIATAQKWLFKPFIDNGQPITVQGKLEIFFAQNSGLSSSKKPVLRIE
jgi:hypothetical protein